MQQREVLCKRSDDLAVVGDDLCDPRKKPELTQNCNSLPCPAGYVKQSSEILSYVISIWFNFWYFIKAHFSNWCFKYFFCEIDLKWTLLRIKNDISSVSGLEPSGTKVLGTWNNVNTKLWHHMASQDHDESMIVVCRYPNYWHYYLDLKYFVWFKITTLICRFRYHSMTLMESVWSILLE